MNLDLASRDADSMFWFDPVDDIVQPCASDPPPVVISPEKTHWIEIALIDQHDLPVAGQAYEIRLPNGRMLTGSLDSRGMARIEGIDPGTCKVGFPGLDEIAWDPI